MQTIDDLMDSFDRILENLHGSGMSEETKKRIIESKNKRANPVRANAGQLDVYFERENTKRLLRS